MLTFHFGEDKIIFYLRCLKYARCCEDTEMRNRILDDLIQDFESCGKDLMKHRNLELAEEAFKKVEQIKVKPGGEEIGTTPINGFWKGVLRK